MLPYVTFVTYYGNFIGKVPDHSVDPWAQTPLGCTSNTMACSHMGGTLEERERVQPHTTSKFVHHVCVAGATIISTTDCNGVGAVSEESIGWKPNEASPCTAFRSALSLWAVASVNPWADRIWFAMASERKWLPAPLGDQQYEQKLHLACVLRRSQNNNQRPMTKDRHLLLGTVVVVRASWRQMQAKKVL